MKDMVNHPEHYISDSGIEVIDVIEAFTSDLKGIEATDTGNIIKYICRWKHKNELEDLKKAQWYLNHLINKVEGNKPKSPCNNALKHSEHMPTRTPGGALRFEFGDLEEADQFYYKVFKVIATEKRITESDAYKIYFRSIDDRDTCCDHAYNDIRLYKLADNSGAVIILSKENKGEN